MGRSTLTCALEQMSNIVIPFNSEVILAIEELDGSVSLTEIYALESPFFLRSASWGSWNPHSGILNIVSQSLLTRRADLNGITLHVAAGHDPPYDYLFKDKNGSPMMISGYSSDVWKQLESRLNFTSVIHEANDNEWGSIKDNGMWSGMMGMVVNNEVDAAVNRFLMTPARVSAVDFPTPLARVWEHVFIKNPSILDSRWIVFLLPFTFPLWVTLICVMISIAVKLFVLDKILKKHWNDPTSYSYEFQDTLFGIFGTFCNQGQSLIPKKWSCRIVFWVGYITALAIFASYSAKFMAYLTVDIPTYPFTSLDGLLKDGTYTFAVLAESGILTILKNATDETMRTLYNTLIYPNLDSMPGKYEEIFHQACTLPHYAFLESSETYALYSHKVRCKLLILPEASFPQHLGIIVRKNLPYRQIFKHTLIQMRETGFLSRIYLDKLPKEAETPESALKSIGLGDVVSLFAFLFLFMVWSVVIYVIEKMKTGKEKNKERNLHRFSFIHNHNVNVFMKCFK